MNAEDKWCLTSNRKYLLDNVEVQYASNALLSQGILTEDEVEELAAIPNPRDRSAKLLNWLPRKGPAAYGIFRSCFEDMPTQHHIIKKLDTTDLSTMPRNTTDWGGRENMAQGGGNMGGGNFGNSGNFGNYGANYGGGYNSGNFNQGAGNFVTNNFNQDTADARRVESSSRPTGQQPPPPNTATPTPNTATHGHNVQVTGNNNLVVTGSTIQNITINR